MPAKLSIYCFILLAVSQCLHAQWRTDETVDHAFTTISISAGIAIPVNHYAGKTNFDKSGYAKLGWMVQGDGSIALNGNIAAAVNLGAFNNPIDKTKLLQQRYAGLLEENMSDTNLETEAWQQYFITVGPSISLPEEYLVLQVKPMIGVLYSQGANWTYNLNGESLNYSRDAALGLAYNFKVAFHFRLTDPFRIVAETGVLGAAPSFTQSQEVQSSSEVWDASWDSQQAINIFSLNLGFGIEF